MRRLCPGNYEVAWKIFPLRLIESRHVTPSILHLVFERDDGVTFDYKAGQFFNIHFASGEKMIHRSYSVANTPGDDFIEIAMSPVEGGKATKLLSGLAVGNVIEASGPYGRFILKDDEPTRYVLVATGTGVTPYRAMLPLLEERLAQGFSVAVIVGIWRREESLYADDFLAMARKHDRFDFQACYSRDFPDDPSANEYHGYVQTRFEEMNLNPEKDIVYLCGNPNMIDQATTYLKDAGFPTPHLRREKYLSARS